jgi:hypothetical protein
MLSPSAEEATFAAIREELVTLFKKVGERWANDLVSS